MKYILFLYVMWGNAPVTAEQHVITTAEFDDLPACEAVIESFRKGSRTSKIQGKCFPKGSSKFPPAAPVTQP